MRQLPCLDVRRARAGLLDLDLLTETTPQGDGDRGSEGVLQCEKIGAGPLQGGAPNLFTGRGVHERHADAEPVAGLRDRPLDQRSDTQCAYHAVRRHLGAFVQAHAVARDDLNALQVRFEHAATDAGDLAADAAQVLGLAAPGDLIAHHRLLSTNGTLHAHVRSLP